MYTIFSLCILVLGFITVWKSLNPDTKLKLKTSKQCQYSTYCKGYVYFDMNYCCDHMYVIRQESKKKNHAR